MQEKKEKRHLRHKRVRGKVFGTLKRPRLCVFRSSKHIYAQLIDDEKGKVLGFANDLKLKKKRDKLQKTKDKSEAKDKKVLSGKLVIAFEVGKLIAQKAKELKINEIIFDRGGYKYHGRVKTLAEGARTGGLKF